MAVDGGGWMPGWLRAGFRRTAAPHGGLRGAHLSRRCGRRVADRGANTLRVRRQSQDRQGARSDGSAIDPRPRRRGDRMITRRALIAGGLGLLSARAATQPADLPLVGALFISSPDLSYVWKHLVADMRTLGYTEGATVRYAARFTQDPRRLPALATEIAALSPHLVYANGDEPARVAAAQWPTVPIVAFTDDHVGAGLTNSLAHPSRNITGVSRLEAELDTKRLELLHELAPSAHRLL